MYSTLEDRRENAPKSRGQKEKCTEIKKSRGKIHGNPKDKQQHAPNSRGQ